MTSGWTSTSSELFQMSTLIVSFIKRKFCGESGDKFEVPSIPYHSEIPRILFFGVLGITYFLLAPLILPFLLVYYCLGYIIYRNQVSWEISFFPPLNVFLFFLCISICIENIRTTDIIYIHLPL